VDKAIPEIAQAVWLITPELLLLGVVCLKFLIGPFLVSESGQAKPGLEHRWGSLALAAVAGAMWLWWDQQVVTTPTLGPFRLDAITWYTRGLMLSAAFILVLLTWSQSGAGVAAESQACLLAIVAGVNLISAANDLAMLFLALELVSIPTYLYLSLPRRDELSQEATVKYFLLSLFSSAFVLYGFSMLYGATGTTNLTAIQAVLASSQSTLAPPLVLVGVVLVLAGLSFRVTAVPFHFYAPDVFQGAPVSGAALLSFVPKVAGFIALVRLMPVDAHAASAGFDAWMMLKPVLWWLAVLTMFLGNLLALIQTDVRRLLAYSSIAHAGYLLVGLYAGHEQRVATPDGVGALFFYLPVYGLMTLGLFAVLAAAGSLQKPITTFDDLAGLSRRHPALALALLVLVFSLTGLPLTGGFLGKVHLFWAAWNLPGDGGQSLAVILTINAAIAAAYYLKLIAAAYFEAPAPHWKGDAAESSGSSVPAAIASGLCAALSVAMFFSPSWVWGLINGSF
jgi:NADH-quinone oxidoreductase subunit N